MKNKLHALWQRFVYFKKSDKDKYLKKSEECYRPALIFFEDDFLIKFRSETDQYPVAHLLDNDGNNPLMRLAGIECTFKDEDYYAYLYNLSKNKLFDINQKNKEGYTALAIWIKKRVAKLLWANEIKMAFDTKLVITLDRSILMSFRASGADFLSKDSEGVSIIDYYDVLPKKQAKHFKKCIEQISSFDRQDAKETFYKLLESKKKFFKDLEDLSKKS